MCGLNGGNSAKLYPQSGSSYVHPTTKQCNYSYTHPSTKQCNYTPNLSNYYTKAEIDSKLSELEGSMPPSLVGTYDLSTVTYRDFTLSGGTIPVSKCDYIEVSLGSGWTPRSSTIMKGSSFEFAFHTYSAESREMTITMELSSDGTYIRITEDNVHGEWDSWTTYHILSGGSVKCYG